VCEQASVGLDFWVTTDVLVVRYLHFIQVTKQGFNAQQCLIDRIQLAIVSASSHLLQAGIGLCDGFLQARCIELEATLVNVDGLATLLARALTQIGRVGHSLFTDVSIAIGNILTSDQFAHCSQINFAAFIDNARLEQCVVLTQVHHLLDHLKRVTYLRDGVEDVALQLVGTPERIRFVFRTDFESLKREQKEVLSKAQTERDEAMRERDALKRQLEDLRSHGKALLSFFQAETEAAKPAKESPQKPINPFMNMPFYDVHAALISSSVGNRGSVLNLPP
jgi:hypothetical protein